MAIPVCQGDCLVTARRRGQTGELLRAAGEVFARSGLDAPMPEIAAAAGAGVGSVYRQFPSKRELLAALVVERLEEVTADAEAAIVSPAGPWAALVSLLRDYAERQAGDDVVGEAIACVSTDPDVVLAYATTTAALERLLEAGRERGSPAVGRDRRRPAADLRRDPRGGAAGARGLRRMLELGIDSLDTRRD